MSRWAAIALTTALAATAPSTIVDLQSARRIETLHLDGESPARVAFINLNPTINAWWLLRVDRSGGSVDLHLENPDPRRQTAALDPAGRGLRLSRDGAAVACSLPLQSKEALRNLQAAKVGAYVALCDGRVYLRRAVAGHRTLLEATTQFLRDHVWGGERIVGFVRDEFYRDAFVERARPASGSGATPARAPASGAPPAADVRASAAQSIAPGALGIATEPAGGLLQPGRWHSVRGAPGIWLSAVQPGTLVAARERIAAEEADALVYLVAFELDRFDLHFALGTDHPRLGWSPRTRREQRDDARPGPDGIDDAAPLVRNGLVPPWLVPRLAAAFTGGFKREHGAFSFGPLAERNAGSHYGFIEQGVVFSRLQPGLATLLVMDDGSVQMKTWDNSDEPLRSGLRDARQNGVALVERGRGGAAEGPLVRAWGPGNWSGSNSGAQRTLRAGACLIEHAEHRFLVYGYFSSATPVTMASVFLAYDCTYAMHLDMNALEHTYLAVYTRRGDTVGVQNLVQGMSVLDQGRGSVLQPRFVAIPDDRDFFYLLRRERTP